MEKVIEVVLPGIREGAGGGGFWGSGFIGVLDIWF